MTAQDGTPSVDDDALSVPGPDKSGPKRRGRGLHGRSGAGGRARRTYPRAYPSKAGGGRGSGAECRGSGGAAGRPAKSGTAAGLPRARGLHPRHRGAGGPGSWRGALGAPVGASPGVRGQGGPGGVVRGGGRVPAAGADFDVVAHNPNLSITPIMADAIRGSGKGAEIAYYLGKNPGEAAQIAALPPVSQATAIARIEGRLGANAVSVSRAPQPVATLSGRGGSAGKPLEDMDFEEYRRARGF